MRHPNLPKPIFFCWIRCLGSHGLLEDRKLFYCKSQNKDYCFPFKKIFFKFFFTKLKIEQSMKITKILNMKSCLKFSMNWGICCLGYGGICSLILIYLEIHWVQKGFSFALLINFDKKFNKTQKNSYLSSLFLFLLLQWQVLENLACWSKNN